MEQLVNGLDGSALTPYNAFYQLPDPCIVPTTPPLLAVAPEPTKMSFSTRIRSFRSRQGISVDGRGPGRSIFSYGVWIG